MEEFGRCADCEKMARVLKRLYKTNSYDNPIEYEKARMEAARVLRCKKFGGYTVTHSTHLPDAGRFCICSTD